MRPFTKLTQSIDAHFRVGDYAKALEALIEFGRQFPNDQEFRFNRHGILIDIGNGQLDAELVKFGLLDGLSVLRFLESKGLNKHVAGVKYNLANGFYVLYGLKERSDHKAISKSKYLPRAKRFHRQAQQLNEEGGTTDDQCMKLVNLANVYSSLGRIVEAIYCFDEALNIDPSFAMAKANRAKALLYLVNITGEYRTQTYIEIYQQIESVLNDPKLITNGSLEAKKHFELIQAGIREMFAQYPHLLTTPIEYKKVSKSKLGKQEKEYIAYCIQENLFLNFHLHNIESSAATYDSLKFQYIGTIHDTGHRFYELAKRINLLFEDFSTSRYQLAQALMPSNTLIRIGKRTVYINPLDYSRNDLQSGLLRASFQNAYNILDKIAAFLNDYCALSIPDRKVSYMKIWGNAVAKDALLGRDNLNICALYDIYRDFESKHYYPITEMRNALTHRQLVILSIDVPHEQRVSKNSVTFDEFANRTTQLLRFVKSAIIYLVNFVNTEEEKKRKEGGIYIPMPVHTM